MHLMQTRRCWHWRRAGVERSGKINQQKRLFSSRIRPHVGLMRGSWQHNARTRRHLALAPRAAPKPGHLHRSSVTVRAREGSVPGWVFILLINNTNNTRASA